MIINNFDLIVYIDGLLLGVQDCSNSIANWLQQSYTEPLIYGKKFMSDLVMGSHGVKHSMSKIKLWLKQYSHFNWTNCNWIMEILTASQDVLIVFKT